MPKIDKFHPIYNKRLSVTRRKRLRCASEAITLALTLITNLLDYSKSYAGN